MVRLKRFSWWIVLTSLVFLLFGGCGEDNPEEPSLQSELNVLYIIANPLTPEPNGVATLTVQSDGIAEVGDNPDFTWSVDAGSLSSRKGYSVEWFTPDTTGLYTVSVEGVLEGKKRAIEKKIMLRYSELVNTVPEFNYYFSPKPITSNVLYFIGLPKVGTQFDYLVGWSVFRLNADGSVDHMVNNEEYFGGYYFRFYEQDVGVSYYVGSMFPTSFWTISPKMDVCVIELLLFQGLDNLINITNDQSEGIKGRYNRHICPRATKNVRKIVWEQQIIGDEEDGSENLYNIGYCNNSFSGNPTVQTITESHDSVLSFIDTLVTPPDTNYRHRYYKNIKPLFTPDQQSIIYFVDTTGVFEPCIIDLDGKEVDLDSRRAMMVDENTGVFGKANVKISEDAEFEWNPTFDILGFKNSAGMLCFFDYQSEYIEVVNEAKRITEFAWSPDGTECAAVNEDGIVRVSIGSGEVFSVFFKEVASDIIVGLNWSDDKILYQVMRSGKSVVEDVYASYSALMVYSLEDEDQYFYYVSPRMPLFMVNPLGVPMRWMRGYFEEGNSGVIAPVFTGNNVVRLYRSYE